MSRESRNRYSRHRPWFSWFSLAAALAVFALWSVCASAASAPPVTPAAVTYHDPVGDAGNAPDVASVTVSPASQTSEGPTTGARARWLRPIMNESWPNEVDKHFAGKPLATVPASTIGYPDGTCWVYSNDFYCAAIKCFGGINTG